ncbi:hypothetical protein INT43_006099 [Umbelopsis isabellina]|uniref:AB hydrolase-1 domain-containing protein n=1 Tax=Mortierella isabellina TaxID=91625 RepID=A0A8H7PJC5_MORIS|nr:hypothetical protein INT43_006099 [Umbelopsis isabellina]
MVQTGNFVAGKKRTHLASLYYEIHGNGPEKICLVMGCDELIVVLYRPNTLHLQANIPYLSLITVAVALAILPGDSMRMFLLYMVFILYKDYHVLTYHEPQPSTSQLANDTIELLDHLGWDKDVNLVGISMGGMISLEVAYRTPERLSSLILTSTTARRNIPTWKTVSALAKVALFTPDPRDKVQTIVDLLYPADWLSQAPSNPKLAKYETNRDYATHSFIKHATKSRLQPVRGNIGQSAACLRHNVSDARLKKIKDSNIPTMVITGTIDNFVNPAHSHHLQKILGARYEVFEGSGHAIPEEQADRYNALLEEFFESAKVSKL